MLLVHGTVLGLSFNVPATFFIDLICAITPTRDTEIPTLIAGRIPELNKSVSKKICPSVIEITFVGIYAETSPACVSIIGSAVNEPPPFTYGFQGFRKSFIVAAMVSSLITLQRALINASEGRIHHLGKPHDLEDDVRRRETSR